MDITKPNPLKQFFNSEFSTSFHASEGCSGPDKTNEIKVGHNGKYIVSFYMPTTKSKIRHYSTLLKAINGAKAGVYSECRRFRIDSFWDTDASKGDGTLLPDSIENDRNFDGGDRRVHSSKKTKVTLICLNDGKVRANYEDGTKQDADYEYFTKPGSYLEDYEVTDETTADCQGARSVPCSDPNDKGFMTSDCEGCKSGYEDKKDGKGCVEIQGGSGEESEPMSDTTKYAIIGGVALVAILLASR